MKATGAGKAFAAGWSVFLPLTGTICDMNSPNVKRGSRKASAAGRILHRRGNPIFVPYLRI